MTWGAGVPPNAGSYDLYKFDLNTTTLTQQNIGSVKQVVDTSVDEDSGLVYITETNAMSVWDTTTSPWTRLQRHSFGSHPATCGIAVANVSYMPDLAVDKVDDVADGNCVGVGDNIQYTVSYENTGDTDLSGVTIVDDLPLEADFVSATGGGTHVSGTVTWNIGNVAKGASSSVQVDVQVNSSATPGSTIINYATIDSNETNPTTVQEKTDICVCQAPPADLWAVEYRFGAPPPGYSWSGLDFTTWMEVRIENQGSGDALNVTAKLNNHHPVNMTIHPDPEDRVALGNIPAGSSAWSTGDTFTITIDMSNPQDPDEGWHWDITYTDTCGEIHTIYDVPEFPWCPLAPPFAEQLLNKRLWYPQLTVSKLYPNYPNPFNPETWIPYQVSKDADVTVRIFDTRGQLIKTIALGHQEAGFYISRDKAAYWDGRNQFGEQVSSGVYFYNLNTGDFTATRKMIIMK
jgi:uncharacterized repeat protein (TIGR01451 family)